MTTHQPDDLEQEDFDQEPGGSNNDPYSGDDVKQDDTGHLGDLSFNADDEDDD